MTDMSHSESMHAAVSNESDELVEPVKQGPSEEPSTGEGSEVSPGLGETEEVARSRANVTAAELWTAPDTSQLQDIGVASFGPSIETVHGPDDRILITNTNVYPWRAHASLLITANDGSLWIGTGWFIGPHTLVTAGHVVYIKNSGVPGRDGWVRSIRVMPGRNGASLPYGQVTSSNFRTVTGWATSADPNYDYGAIIVPTELGSTTGWFGFGVYSDDQLTGTTVNISGYPGDKPSGTQWYDYNRVASVNSRKVFYDIDTFGGQSGSAVYRIINGGRYGVAVHAYGGSTTNSGSRITQGVFDNFLKWKV